MGITDKLVLYRVAVMEYLPELSRGGSLSVPDLITALKVVIHPLYISNGSGSMAI